MNSNQSGSITFTRDEINKAVPSGKKIKHFAPLSTVTSCGISHTAVWLYPGDMTSDLKCNIQAGQSGGIFNCEATIMIFYTANG